MTKQGLLKAVLVVLGLAAGSCASQAQTSCTPVNQAALLALFSDNLGNSSITPANIRAIVCSMSGGPSGSAAPNWKAGNIPIFGNSGLVGNTTGSYLIDSGSAAPLGVECPPITQYGGTVGGVTDNGPALAAAIAASPIDHACISFPPGKWKFATAFTYSYSTDPYQSITIVGAGADVTELIGPTNASGFAFTLNGGYNSFHIRDLSIETPSACTGCTALALIQGVAPLANPAETAQSDITRVSIYGTDRSAAVPSGSNFWGTGIEINAVSEVNLVGNYIQGILSSSTPAPTPSKGINIHGASATPPVVFNFTSNTINEYYYGLYIGRFVQGVTMVGGNLTNNFYGTYVASLPGDTAAQLDIAASQMNNCENVNVVNGQMSFISVSNSLLLSGQSPFPCSGSLTSLEFGANSFYAQVVGNVFGGGTSTIGVHSATDNAVGGIITGNMFNNFIGGGASAISLDGSASGLIISNNNITSNLTGISIGASVHGVRVAANLMHGNTTDLTSAAPLFANYIDIPQDCSSISGFTFGGGTTGITYGSKYCQFYVTGTSATVDFDFTLTAKGTSTGNATVTVPGAITSGSNVVGSCVVSFYSGMSGVVGQPAGNIVSGQAGIGLSMSGATTSPPLTDANFTNTSRMTGQARYLVPVGE